ncbi:MAG: hypothetical protein Unbinned4497contig1000_27 [Prokaryotic dsDNA virus sp.]|nr:MAG: hypothetical protein Unbinned4497contig1000_27 [Prokaryotic dsDNA virus sp.]|tara:strand:+ start:13979 stop:14926 length:948 start_codon:yes stop_codon:yes gene_type:complete
MVGIASNQLRSAFVAETTANTTPSTPSFTNSDVPINMTATPNIIEHRSLAGKGEAVETSIGGIDVAGTMSGTLVYGAYDDMLESLLQGTWATDVLKNAKTTQTFTVENAIAAGDGGTNTMMRYTGVEVSGGSITLTSNADITFAFDLLGMGSADTTTSAITGATYTDQSQRTPLSSGLDVGTIAMAGYTLDAFESATINFTYEGREAQNKLGSDYAKGGITKGALLAEITARVYVDSNFASMYNAARDNNHTLFSTTFPLGSVSGSKYTLVFPKCKFTTSNLDFTGTAAMQDVTIRAMYDEATEDASVKLTRAVS